MLKLGNVNTNQCYILLKLWNANDHQYQCNANAKQC